LPHYSPVTKEVAAQLLNVHWKQLDEWVAEGKLNPLAKTRGQYRFTIEELEQFQRENESEVDIAEIWQAQQTK
jgi:excisionase family DNA binding protein